MTISQTVLKYLENAPHTLGDHSISQYLSSHTAAFLNSSEASIDTAEIWLLYEQMLFACLRVQDDPSAQLILQRLGDRFGTESARVRGLAGLYDEAVAVSGQQLEEVLRRYEKIMRHDQTNMPVEKRRVAVFERLGQVENAMTSLTKIVEHSPTDAESWSHLASLYRCQGLYLQSIFCLEEILLIHPNAYSIHARLGETLYLTAEKGDMNALLGSLRYFCRSIELCGWYLRGWYGLKLITDRMIDSSPKSGKGSTIIDVSTLEGLNQKAVTKLRYILKNATTGKAGWQGFDRGELDAATNLLSAR